MAKVVASKKTAEERGSELKGIAEKYTRVQIQVVRTFLLTGEHEIQQDKKIRLQEGVKYPSGGVLDTDDVTFIVKPGLRTVKEEAALHGRALANKLIFGAIDGHDDLLGAVRNLVKNK